MMGPLCWNHCAFPGYATMVCVAGTIAMGAAVYLEATRRSWGRESRSSNNPWGVWVFATIEKYFCRVLR